MTKNAQHEKSNTVYKIVPSASWAAAVAIGFFDGSSDDQREGFIHLSNKAQVDGTLRKYFRDQVNLVLIAFDSADLAPLLRWEASRGGDLFPHYYGRLPVNLARWRKPLPLGGDGVPAIDEGEL